MPKCRLLTKQAQHVLANLDRVLEKPYVIEVRSPHRRSELDGVECTTQITSLIVGGLVSESASGALTYTSQGRMTLGRMRQIS